MERERKKREREQKGNKNRQGCEDNFHSLCLIDQGIGVQVRHCSSAGTSHTSCTSRIKCGHESAISNKVVIRGDIEKHHRCP